MPRKFIVAYSKNINFIAPDIDQLHVIKLLVKVKYLIISMFHSVPGVPRVKMERYFVKFPLVYLSTSPSTKSIEPTIAIKSAIITPFASSGNTDRLWKLGARHFTRVGISDLPSAIK